MKVLPTYEATLKFSQFVPLYCAGVWDSAAMHKVVVGDRKCLLNFSSGACTEAATGRYLYDQLLKTRRLINNSYGPALAALLQLHQVILTLIYLVTLKLSPTLILALALRLTLLLLQHTISCIIQIRC